MTHCRIAQRRISTGDPHDCTDAADDLAILHTVCDTLVRRQDQGYVPRLAERWSVDATARHWSFDLRPNVNFHDGTPCDAAAVALSLQRMTREDKGYALGSPAVWRQYLLGAEIKVEGPYRLTIKLAEPIADFLDILDQGFIVSPERMARWDAGESCDVIGSGPYRISDRTDATLRMERVPGHFREGANETLIWIAEPDDAARARLFEEGAVDVANHLPQGQGRATVSPGKTKTEFVVPVAIIFLLNAAKGVLADGRLRRALSLAVDRDALVTDVMDGHAKPLHGFISPSHYGADPASPIPYDPDTARALIAEAGFADGLTLNVDCPTSLPDEAERLCAALAEQLAQVGVHMVITTYDAREDYAHMVRRKEIAEMCVFDSSPMSTFRVLYEKIDSRIEGAWWQGYRNKEVEALLDRGRCEPDDAAREALYRAAYRALQDDPAWLTLYNPTRVIGLYGHHPNFSMPVDGVIDAAGLPAMSQDV